MRSDVRVSAHPWQHQVLRYVGTQAHGNAVSLHEKKQTYGTAACVPNIVHLQSEHAQCVKYCAPVMHGYTSSTWSFESYFVLTFERPLLIRIIIIIIIIIIILILE